jgi:heterodisulfide reductase subunit C2
MSSGAHHHEVDNSLAGKVRHNTQVHAQRCYQCGKCSAGCPLSADMDYPPSMILRMLQTGDPVLEDKILRSYTIWVCLSCEMCIQRCPMEVDIPVMMDYLRQESIRQKKVNPKAKNIVSFHRSFLDSIHYTGRLFEFGLVVDYKLRSWKMFQDITMMPGMVSRGKLHFIPERIKGMKNISNIFTKVSKEDKK